MESIFKFFSDRKLVREKDLINFCKNPEIKKLLNKFELNIFDLKYHIKHKLDLCKHKCCICGKTLHLSITSKLTYFPTHCKSCVSKDKYIRKKVEATNLRKFGVKVSSKNINVKERAKSTCLKRYDAIAPTLNQEVLNKGKRTCLAKYGTKFAAQNSSIKKQLSIKTKLKDKKFRDKILRNKFAKTYANISRRAKEKGIILLSPLASYNGKKGTLYKWQCERCKQEFYHTYQNGMIPKCKNCDNTKFKGLENELYNYLIILFPNQEIKRNDRTCISPYEVDFYIPSKKLAIEFNGAYWHSEKMGKSSKYHLDKFRKAKEKGIDLIHIWEWEYRGKNKELTNKRLKLLANSINTLTYIYSLFSVKSNKIKIPLDWFNALKLDAKTSILIAPYPIYSDGWRCENTPFGKSGYKVWNCGCRLINLEFK